MMNKRYRLLFLLIILVNLSFSACTGRKGESKQENVPGVKTPVIVGKETELLLKDLEENGDYVNSQVYPSLIKASIVKESLDQNILVIDLRPSKQFTEGHIKGAVNKKFEVLPAYFEGGIKPFEYDKIIMVCEDGQLSSYTTSLLRLMGYGNVYAMRWGMSAWNSSFAKEGWQAGVSGRFETRLENKVNEKDVPSTMPELNTGFNTGTEIATARFNKLFEEDSSDILISADEVFTNPEKYYIINLDRKDKYEAGHVPGSVRYKPDATLGFPDEMASIPFNITVVIYCGTGHNSGFATAFLRLFGYDARTLKYGNNSFMYDRMVRDKTTLSWLPFTSQDVNDFPVVK